MIRTDNLSRWYQKGRHRIEALKNIFLSVAEGEFLAIMGPSGSGKSTLLHILGCLDRPSAGSYCYDGQEISRLADKARSRIRAREIGFIFQTFNLLPQLTVYENVALPLGYGPFLSSTQIEARVTKAVGGVGLARRLDHLPRELSGGEMQRTAIARAMVIRPKLILADEPTGNLDSRSSNEIMELIKSVNQSGATVVMVTHDPHIAQWAHHRRVLKDGCFE